MSLSVQKLEFLVFGYVRLIIEHQYSQLDIPFDIKQSILKFYPHLFRISKELSNKLYQIDNIQQFVINKKDGGWLNGYGQTKILPKQYLNLLINSNTNDSQSQSPESKPKPMSVQNFVCIHKWQIKAEHENGKKGCDFILGIVNDEKHFEQKADSSSGFCCIRGGYGLHFTSGGRNTHIKLYVGDSYVNKNENENVRTDAITNPTFSSVGIIANGDQLTVALGFQRNHNQNQNQNPTNCVLRVSRNGKDLGIPFLNLDINVEYRFAFAMYVCTMKFGGFDAIPDPY
jgi:hypothetical protein